MIAATPEPPYTAVIFTSHRTIADDDGYLIAAAEMERMAAIQPGFLGVESVRDATTRLGITVSYWSTDDHARAWKAVVEHLAVQETGRHRWYDRYEVRVATVRRSYGFEA